MEGATEMTNDLICWEALDATDPTLERARELYESTQHPDERIPWDWIRGAVGRRKDWRPGRWGTHLLLAGPRVERKGTPTVEGFANCLHLPGYGGYLTYVGVEPASRGRGIGARLVDLAIKALQVDACCEGGELPFVVWESRPPAPGEDASEWAAKLGLWRRAGALWVSGMTLHAVNYAQKGAPPLRLALFLRPVARRAEEFDSAALREVAAGLLGVVYDRQPGDEHFDRTLPADCRPQLRPVGEALGLVADG
jgi:GNAT superfamily N-acetyltransferase